jgi:hypothetical protein
MISEGQKDFSSVGGPPAGAGADTVKVAIVGWAFFPALVCNTPALRTL